MNLFIHRKKAVAFTQIQVLIISLINSDLFSNFIFQLRELGIDLLCVWCVNLMYVFKSNLIDRQNFSEFIKHYNFYVLKQYIYIYTNYVALPA